MVPFLPRIYFIIKYRQENKNGKPDSLSRRPDYIKNNTEEKPENI